MVYYFSGTGNSRHMAERIASALGEEAANMAVCMKRHDFKPQLQEGEAVGFVCATHFFGLPALVEEFLHLVQLPAGHYLYFVATYGTFTGGIGYFARRIMKGKDLRLDAMYSVQMPDTWTPIFNLTNTGKVAERNRQADVEVDGIIRQLLAHDKGDFMRRRMPSLIAILYHRTYRGQRRTGHFYVERQCNGCGKCARECPMEAIYISDRRPTWTKNHCTLCLHCLHSCPKFAIQYGSRTKKHGQYMHP